jgi:hypothetical protein
MTSRFWARFAPYDSTTQKIRSVAVSCGRGWRAFHTASCCRSARFSIANSRRVRRQLLSVPTRILSHRAMTARQRISPQNANSSRRTTF